MCVKQYANIKCRYNRKIKLETPNSQIRRVVISKTGISQLAIDNQTIAHDSFNKERPNLAGISV